ncbi:MAG: bifunctional heptose 7-phosphate kinase/heptose 1-phosphate adenyltransferase [Limnochordia bacterium]|jgi:rfaE bifunctional protein kinase chain/domain
MDTMQLEQILKQAEKLKIMVVGDYFLDHYLFIDPTKEEFSRETGKRVYQVVQVESSPGAAGSVVSKLSALGVPDIIAVGAIGRDTYGFELKRLLQAEGADISNLLESHDRVTPTYIKPTLRFEVYNEELNRLDIKNWSETPRELEDRFISTIKEQGPTCDAVIVIDQVDEPECGVITSRVRRALRELGEQHPQLIILVDSRSRIHEFSQVMIKPNEFEAGKALGLDGPIDDPARAARTLFQQTLRPVFLTCGENGQWVYDGTQAVHAPALRVEGPIDIVGAGDSTSAGIVVALASGAAPQDAAFFGNLVASITITKLGTTGTASPQEIRARFHEYSRKSSGGTNAE